MASTMNSDWAGGYRTDIEYVTEFYAALNPDQLLLKTVLAGFRPPVPVVATAPGARRMTYCELGFGQGLTLNYMAARDPDGRYYGIDHNPIHAANARALADAAALSNLTVLEESFSDLENLDLPDFDIVVLHGVYSWITNDISAHVRQFLRQKLKPGGLVYVSYNCSVGRIAEMPLRQLLIESEKIFAGEPAQNVAQAFELTNAIADGGAKYFQRHPTSLKSLEEIGKADPAYVIHEFLNESWRSYFFHEVAAELSEAKLSFVGSADLLMTVKDICLPPDAHANLDKFRGTGAKELYKDIWHNQKFRQDIFVKGVSKLNAAQQLQIVSSLRFCLIRDRRTCALTVDAPAGEATLADDPYALLLDALADGIRTGAELGAVLEHKSEGGTGLLDAIRVLLAIGYIVPAVSAANQPCVVESMRRLDEAVAAEVDKGKPLYLVSAPAIGSVHEMSAPNYILMRMHRDGVKDVPRAVYDKLTADGHSVSMNGEDITDEAAALEVLKELNRKFEMSIAPMFRRTGTL